MLNRRMIRIKVFKVLFSTISSGSNSIISAEKELIQSCDKSLDLYYYMFSLLYAVRNVAINKIDTGLKKYYPTPEEANPNRKFVENSFFEILENDAKLLKIFETKALLWPEESTFIVKKIFNSIVESDYYKEYMSSDERSRKEDFTLIKTIFECEMEDCDELNSILEEKSLYWIDDLAYILNIIIRNIDVMRDKRKFIYPSIFIKEEDKDYAMQLLNKSLVRYDELFDLISKSVDNWDSDRLVSTDILLIIMGLTEAIEFPSIPVKVTINEYVEIAKFYSTPNSKIFVNGLLDKLIQKLLKQGDIVKVGRGLLES